MLWEAVHGRGNTWRGAPVMLRPCMVIVRLRMTDKASLSRSELHSSGRVRPLSQLLPDLQLNQHGFSPPLVFFQRKPRSAEALTCHRVALGEIKLSGGFAPFAPSSGRRANLARWIWLQSRHRQKRKGANACNYRQGALVWTLNPPPPGLSPNKGYNFYQAEALMFKQLHSTSIPFARGENFGDRVWLNA